MFSVGLPLARPAIVGGLLLALLEVMNEYGAMTFYGIETLTTGIFVSWTDLGDKDSAIRLAAIAMIFVLLIIILERLLRGRAKFRRIDPRKKIYQSKRERSLVRSSHSHVVVYCFYFHLYFQLLI